MRMFILKLYKLLRLRKSKIYITKLEIELDDLMFTLYLELREDPIVMSDEDLCQKICTRNCNNFSPLDKDFIAIISKEVIDVV